MPNFKDVQLTSGKTVRVYAPPSSKLYWMVAAKYPELAPPVVESKTVTGETIKMIIEDDPDYLVDVKAREDRITAETNEATTLFALKDEMPPGEFDIESTYGELIRVVDEKWEPRAGKMGQKLDWIEWELLGNPSDTAIVQVTITELISVNMEVVSAIGDSFQSRVEGKTT